MAKKSRSKHFWAPLRIHVVLFIFLFVVNLILGRLFYLQISRHQIYLAKADSQQNVNAGTDNQRGQIFIRSDNSGNYLPATVNQYQPYAYAVPKEVKNPSVTAEELASILSLDKYQILLHLTKASSSYEVIAKRIGDDAANTISSKKLSGIYIGKELVRLYPLDTIAANVIGFVSPDDQGGLAGRYGLEASYEDILNGTESSFDIIAGIKNAAANLISNSNLDQSQGADLYLTIDSNIQHEADDLLAQAMKDWKAKSGDIIVMEADTGKILAMADAPTFDPNTYNQEKDYSVFLNRAVSNLYEPGSVFKGFTMAAGLESGAVNASTTYYDSGEAVYNGHIIRNAGNSAPKRQVTMAELLEHSYNVGAVFVAMHTGASYLKNFWLNELSLNEPSGIDLPDEASGNFSNLSPPEGRDINFATASFGQGVSMTAIKLVQGFAALANGGNLVQPYVVDKIAWPDGSIQTTQPKILKQVISKQTFATLLPMLEQVVEGSEGSGYLGRIPGYELGGKTGTGQIPNGRGGYSDTKVNHTFIGFGPLPDSRFVVLVHLNDPIGRPYAESTVTPVFHDLMKFILQYYQIPPTGDTTPPCYQDKYWQNYCYFWGLH